LEFWEPEDQAVLRSITHFLQPPVQAGLSKNCDHLKGDGGSKGAIQEIRRLLQTGCSHLVARSDAKRYYGNTLLDSSHEGLGKTSKI